VALTHVQVNCACGWSGSHNCTLGIRTLDRGLIAKLRKILPYDYSGRDEWADADKLSEVFSTLWHLEDEGE
jgi:hypothetical protein